jgi:LytS/YehU family sensor histidine kinase
MPFVENAFKHAARGDGPERVRVRCEIERDRVTFRCVNPYEARNGAAEGPGGLGQSLVRRRLELVYPGRHALQLERAAGDYAVTLTIRPHEDEGPA